jgi:hypothetical protein
MRDHRSIACSSSGVKYPVLCCLRLMSIILFTTYMLCGIADVPSRRPATSKKIDREPNSSAASLACAVPVSRRFPNPYRAMDTVLRQSLPGKLGAELSIRSKPTAGGYSSLNNRQYGHETSQSLYMPWSSSLWRLVGFARRLVAGNINKVDHTTHNTQHQKISAILMSR